MTSKTVTRIVKPSAGRWVRAFCIVLVSIYVLSIPLTWYSIQMSGMGVKPGTHLTIGKLLVGIAMLCLLWAPLCCGMLAPVLVPVAALAAFIGASIRRVPIVAEPGKG